MQPNQEVLRVAGRGMCAILLLQLVSIPLVAKTTSFNPRVALTSTYTDNVRFVGQSSGSSDSDIVTGLRVTLPVQKQGQHSSLLFRYDIAGNRYQDFSSLDNVAHALRLDYTLKLSRVSSLNVRAKYLFTQDQADPEVLEDSEDPDPFLAGRTERESGSLSVRYARNIGSRWEWFATGLARRSDFELIENFNPGTGLMQLPEDKDGYAAGTGAWRRFSKNTRLGARYSFGRTDLSVTGRVETHDFRFTFDSRLTKRFGLRGEVGAFYRDNIDTGETNDGATIIVLLKFNDGIGFTAGPVRFDFGAGLTPSYGGAIEGTSANAAVFASMKGVRTRPVEWGVTTRYGQRRSDLFGQPNRNTLTFVAYGEVGIRRLLGFRLTTRHSNQDIPSQPSSSFYSVRASFVWYPLGRTRVAGR